MAHQLSKSRYLAGLQCAKLLWWRTHEPEAPELVPGPQLEAVFARGNQVGEAARLRVPGGVLIERDLPRLEEAVEATREALEGSAPAIYEAAFLEDGVFVAVDILERDGKGWNLIEVKSSTKLKDEHLPDVAVQVHVLQKAGLKVKRAFVMTLSRECVHPHLDNLFERHDVTRQVKKRLADVPSEIRRQRRVLGGPLPEVEVGRHCDEPYACPFQARCWPELPDHHVSTLYMARQAAEALLAQGVETLDRVPADFPLGELQRRQVQAARTGLIVVGPGLKRALAELGGHRGYLDFETVGPAIPCWPGCRPYDQVPVQFVASVRKGRRRPCTTSWLADGEGDPRPALAERLLEALDGVPIVLAWYASFEQRCIRDLARWLPALREDLLDLASRVVDLLPVVRNHVYHPDFGGGFSLKAVLPALVPDLAYDDLEIQDGATASLVLERLLLAPGGFEASERARLRRALESYCVRDAEGLVALHDVLERL